MCANRILISLTAFLTVSSGWALDGFEHPALLPTALPALPAGQAQEQNLSEQEQAKEAEEAGAPLPAGGYNPNGFSNFWDAPESPLAESVSREVIPARIQGIILSYLRANPMLFQNSISGIKATRTWEAAGAYARTILEEAAKRKEPAIQIETQLLKNTPKPLTGATVAAILGSSVTREESIRCILISSPHRFEALNELLFHVPWEELRGHIESVRLVLGPEDRASYEAEVRAWSQN